jgi:hypothetical protein
LTIASLFVAVLTAVFAAQTGSAPSAPPKAATLDIYWIDVEGGASTLIVTPAGESALMDAGFAGFNDRITHSRRRGAGEVRARGAQSSRFASRSLDKYPHGTIFIRESSRVRQLERLGELCAAMTGRHPWSLSLANSINRDV